MKTFYIKFVLVFSVVLFTSSQIFSQWVAQTSGTTATLRGVRAVSDDIAWACGASGVVLKTTNGGTTWRVLTPTLTAATNYTIDAFDTTTAWVTGTVGGSADVSIWKTTDGGATWVSQYNNPTGFGDGVRFFNTNDGVYYGDPDPWPSGNWELLTTSNGGTNWNRVPRTNFPSADSVNEELGSANSFDIFDDNVWFNSYYNQTTTNAVNVFKSTDKGLNWTSYSIPFPTGGTYGCLAFSSAVNGAIGTINGDLALTSDGGATWAFTTVTGAFRGMTNVPGFNNFIAVGSSGICYYSQNFGPWLSMTTGLTATLRCVDASVNAAWAAGASGTILKAFIDSLLVGINTDQDVKMPNEFGLSQNYPNPFNPTTTISYEIAKETNVSLKVYDAIGNEVATLINETKPAGAYQVIFDAASLSNGVYFYKIQAGNFTETKKLILMK